jgi:hypothetical protein
MEQSEAQRLYSYIGDSHNDLGVYTVNGGYGPPLPESNRKKKKKNNPEMKSLSVVLIQTYQSTTRALLGRLNQNKTHSFVFSQVLYRRL